VNTYFDTFPKSVTVTSRKAVRGGSRTCVAMAMNTWEPIFGKPIKREGASHGLPMLRVSDGGQGPSVGVTRMSRGRFAEAAACGSPRLRQAVLGSTIRKRSLSPGTGRAAPRDWYLQECAVRKTAKQTLFAKVGGEIGKLKTCLGLPFKLARFFRRVLSNSRSAVNLPNGAARALINDVVHEPPRCRANNDVVHELRAEERGSEAAHRSDRRARREKALRLPARSGGAGVRTDRSRGQAKAHQSENRARVGGISNGSFL